MNGKQHQVVGIGFGIAGGIIGLTQSSDFMALAIPVGSAIACWWPDIDHNNSKLGRKRKAVTSALDKTLDTTAKSIIAIAITGLVLDFLNVLKLGNLLNIILFAAIIAGVYLIVSELVGNSKHVKWAKKHRGIMHTLLMPIILYITANAVDQSLWRFLFIGFTVGYVSHLVSDSVTPDKVPALWPITTEPIGITLVKRDKVPKDDKEAKKRADEKFNKKCTALANGLAVSAIVFAIIYSFGGLF